MTAPCDNLHAFFDGELAAAVADAFREHLAGCAACQTELADIIQLDDTVIRAGPPIISLAAARRRRRLVVAAVAAVAAAAAGILLVVRQRPRQVMLATAPTRPFEGRLSHAGADRYRPYDVVRGGPTAVEPIALKTLGALEEQHDERGLAAGHLLSGNREQAAAALARAPASADVNSDRALLALLDDRAQEGLVLADVALEAQPRHGQARWNRALALRDLHLSYMAAAAFDDVARLGEPGWAEEAIGRATALRASLALAADRYWRVRAACLRMVQGGEPPSVADVRDQPGMTRLFFHDAVRAAQSREQALRLMPIAEELDRLYRGDRLADTVRQAANADFARRAPLAARYAKIAAGERLDEKAQADYLTELRAAHADDLLRGALILIEPTRIVRETRLAEYRALVEATGDPWFQLVYAEQKAQNQLARGAYVEAEAELLRAFELCEKENLSYRCARLGLVLGKIYLSLHRLADGRAVLEKAWAHARQVGDLPRESDILLFLQQVVAFGGDYVGRNPLLVAKAYSGEMLAREPASCFFRADAHEVLALQLINQVRLEEARAELDLGLAARRGCSARPFDDRLAFLEAHLVRPGAETDELRAQIRTLRETGKLPPGELAALDQSEGRALIRADRPAGEALLRRAITAAEARPGWDIAAQRARAYSYTVLVDEAAAAGEEERALSLIAEEAGIPAGERCLLGVSVESSLTVVARGPDGAIAASVTPRREPSIDASRLVNAGVRRALAGCEVIDVLARAPLHGRTDLLPPDVAWRYRWSAGPAVEAHGPPRRVVVADVSAPAALKLPPLQPWQGGAAAVLVSGAAATPTRVLRELEDATEIEIHAHGVANLAAAEASYIALAPEANGAFALTAGQLQRGMLRGAPIVILAACEAAATPSAYHQTWTLPLAFLRAGARTVLASPEPIQDAGAGRFFEAVRARIHAGARPAVALRDERQAWLAADPKSWVQRVLVFE